VSNLFLFFFFLKIGGAERLIVDAACELVSHGHYVHVFTAHHDKNRCFEETVSGENWITVNDVNLLNNLNHRLITF
jgi:alpha-1,3/alpha-1,6-mannosyltransferase